MMVEFAIGGHHQGGFIGLLFSQSIQRHRCQLVKLPDGIQGIDSPLDLFPVQTAGATGGNIRLFGKHGFGKCQEIRIKT